MTMTMKTALGHAKQSRAGPSVCATAAVSRGGAGEGEGGTPKKSFVRMYWTVKQVHNKQSMNNS